jgi:hypothetical protein
MANPIPGGEGLVIGLKRFGALNAQGLAELNALLASSPGRSDWNQFVKSKSGTETVNYLAEDPTLLRLLPVAVGEIGAHAADIGTAGVGLYRVGRAGLAGLRAGKPAIRLADEAGTGLKMAEPELHPFYEEGIQKGLAAGVDDTRDLPFYNEPVVDPVPPPSNAERGVPSDLYHASPYAEQIEEAGQILPPGRSGKVGLGGSDSGNVSMTTQAPAENVAKEWNRLNQLLNAPNKTEAQKMLDKFYEIDRGIAQKIGAAKDFDMSATKPVLGDTDDYWTDAYNSYTKYLRGRALISEWEELPQLANPLFMNSADELVLSDLGTAKPGIARVERADVAENIYKRHDPVGVEYAVESSGVPVRDVTYEGPWREQVVGLSSRTPDDIVKQRERIQHLESIIAREMETEGVETFEELMEKSEFQLSFEEIKDELNGLYSSVIEAEKVKPPSIPGLQAEARALEEVTKTNKPQVKFAEGKLTQKKREIKQVMSDLWASKVEPMITQYERINKALDEASAQVKRYKNFPEESAGYKLAEDTIKAERDRVAKELGDLNEAHGLPRHYKWGHWYSGAID